MTDDERTARIQTRIWHEEPEPDNPFATRVALCHGYDVYGEMLGQARWVEMLFLLFRGNAPTPEQADMLEVLSVALANAGPRDPAVHAAMCGGTCGSTAASILMAAVAAGAGQLSGARDVYLAMEIWASCGPDLDAWRKRLEKPVEDPMAIWPAPEHPPGFDPHGVRVAAPIRQTLACLAQLSPGPRLAWLVANLDALTTIANCPLALSGVAAAAFADIGFSPAQGEMLHLLLRLPGAAAHALEQQEFGHKKFPFFELDIVDDPGRGGQ